MSHETNSETEILARLGILNSTLESPHKMSAKMDNRRRAVLNTITAGSLSDDSDSEIIFDRNALLNARKRRRRQRSSSTRMTNFNETLKWKLSCLSMTFVCMGLATVVIGLTKSDIMANVNETSLHEYAKIFVFGGIGYFTGSVFVSLIFTRLNAYICIPFLLATSLPFTVMIIYQTQLEVIKLFVFCQFCLFGAIERGVVLVIYGVLKGNIRTVFMLYMAFTVGCIACSVFTREEVFTKASLIGHQTHSISKREIENISETSNNTHELQAVTRPHAAFGVDEDQNTKTRENAEKRKQAQAIKESLGTERSALPRTLPQTTASTTTTVTPSQSEEVHITFNRARNRFGTTTTAILRRSTETSKGTKMPIKLRTSSQFVYTSIAVITTITIGLFLVGFCACCIRFNLIADVRVAQIALDVSSGAPIPKTTRLLLIICWVLQTLPEAIFLALLPHYLQNLKYSNWNTQNNISLMTSVFWFVVFGSKMFVFLFPYVPAMTIWIKFGYVVGISSCFLFHWILDETEFRIYFGLLSLSFSIFSLPQLTLSCMQIQLDASPYLMTKYYFASTSLSRTVGPMLSVLAINRSGSIHGMMTFLTFILCLSLLFFVLLSRSVLPLARQRQLFELTGDINGRYPSTSAPTKQKTRKGQYEKLLEEDDADVEMEHVLSDILASDSDSI